MAENKQSQSVSEVKRDSTEGDYSEEGNSSVPKIKKGISKKYNSNGEIKFLEDVNFLETKKQYMELLSPHSQTKELKTPQSIQLSSLRYEKEQLNDKNKDLKKNIQSRTMFIQLLSNATLDLEKQLNDLKQNNNSEKSIDDELTHLDSINQSIFLQNISMSYFEESLKYELQAIEDKYEYLNTEIEKFPNKTNNEEITGKDKVKN